MGKSVNIILFCYEKIDIFIHCWIFKELDYLMKCFITPESLREDSFILGTKVVNDGFVPDFIVAIWRGGAPIGCYVHELLKIHDINSDHIAIRTSRYTGIDQAESVVKVFNLGYLAERVKPESKVLLVDDVFDTGISIAGVFEAFKKRFGDNMPEDIRVATVHYKPERNQTDRKPEYYVKETNQWIVYPHELEGLTKDELCEMLGNQLANSIIPGNK